MKGAHVLYGCDSRRWGDDKWFLLLWENSNTPLHCVDAIADADHAVSSLVNYPRLNPCSADLRTHFLRSEVIMPSLWCMQKLLKVTTVYHLFLWVGEKAIKNLWESECETIKHISNSDRESISSPLYLRCCTHTPTQHSIYFTLSWFMLIHKTFIYIFSTPFRRAGVSLGLGLGITINKFTCKTFTDTAITATATTSTSWKFFKFTETI